MGRREPEEESEEDHRKSVLLVTALVAAAAAIVASVFLLLKDKGTYAKGIGDLNPALVGKPVRVEGALVHGSIEKRRDGCEWRFRMRGGETELPVRYESCTVPSDFHDKPDETLLLTVEGSVDEQGSLEATKIMTKCPSRYDKEKDGPKPGAAASMGAPRPFISPLTANAR